MSSTRVSVRYGKGRVWVEVPEGNLAAVMRPTPRPGLPDPATAVAESIQRPISSAPLLETARGRRDAVVVISDVTRPVPNASLLPPILSCLESAGIPKERVLILVATGMHRPNEGEELRELVGEDIASAYRIENHLGLDLDSHVDLGTSEEGIPLLVDRRYMEADLKVVTGLIEPHLIAGYSGGRKGVLPGVCALKTMKVMHGFRMIQHPRSAVGVLDGNPFHEAALRLARQAGVDFLVNVTMNEDREITGVYSGDLDAAHRAGCAALEEYIAAEVEGQVDVVVTCGGGYPLDQTLYQSFKGTVAAREILRPGGSMVMAAHLGEGIGSRSFQEMLERLESPESMLEILGAHEYLQVDQWMIQDHCNMLVQAGEHFIYSENLDDVWAERARLKKTVDLQDGLNLALERHGRDARVAVLPEGPYVVARTREGAAV